MSPVRKAMQVQALPTGLAFVADGRSLSPLPTPAALAKLAIVSLYFRFNRTARLQKRKPLSQSINSTEWTAAVCTQECSMICQTIYLHSETCPRQNAGGNPGAWCRRPICKLTGPRWALQHREHAQTACLSGGVSLARYACKLCLSFLWDALQHTCVWAEGSVFAGDMTSKSKMSSKSHLGRRTHQTCPALQRPEQVTEQCNAQQHLQGQ